MPRNLSICRFSNDGKVALDSTKYSYSLSYLLALVTLTGHIRRVETLVADIRNSKETLHTADLF
jgi:hypothetical protein